MSVGFGEAPAFAEKICGAPERGKLEAVVADGAFIPVRHQVSEHEDSGRRSVFFGNGAMGRGV